MTNRAESEEWLDNLLSEVEDIIDSVEEYLEGRADEPPSVIGEFSVVADVLSEVDDNESRNSESSLQVVNSAQEVRQITVEICTVQRE